MKYLLRDRQEINRFLGNKRLFLFLDYDGTLTPIKKRPEEAKMPEEAKSALRRLSKNPRNKIAIVSGRSLKDIKKIVGLRNLVYVGNHGLEIKGSGITFKYPLPPAYTALLAKVKKELVKRLFKIKGVLMEDKKLTISVHFRQAKENDEILVKDIFHGIVWPHLERKAFRVTSGKKVFEIRPAVRWDKGKAVLWLLARHHFSVKNHVTPIYIGDDVTDEDAFRALNKRGITVFVGHNPLSKARHYVNNNAEVIEFLKIAASRSMKKYGGINQG